jgi:hypothetical protein
MFQARRGWLAGILVSAVAMVAAACGGGSSGSPTPVVTSAVAGTGTAQVTTSGYAYVFGKERVDVVDPKTAKVVKEITQGLQGTGTWGDGVSTLDGNYVFINETAKAQVYVFDTAKQDLARAIDVGAKPAHLYLVNGGTEVWTHSDTEGAFYIIDVKRLAVTGKVVASTNGTGHGALVHADSLGTKYYATNILEPAVFVIDGKTRTVTKRIDLCQGTNGTGGTHGDGYSSANKTAYFQCTGAVTKTAAVDTTTDTVAGYLDTNGDLFMSPGDRYAVVANGAANRVDVIDGSTKPETITPIPIPNQPDKVYYATVNGRLLAFVDDLKAPDAEVIDMQTFKVVKSIPGTPLATPLGTGRLLVRNSSIGGGYYFTVVGDEQQLNIIDVNTLAMVGSVEVPGATQVIFAGKQS